MSEKQEHIVCLTKLSERKLQEKVILKNLSTIVQSINDKSKMLSGWTVDETPSPRSSYGEPWHMEDAFQGDNKYKTYAYLKVVYDNPRKDPDNNQYRSILRQLNTRAAQPAIGRWEMSTVDGEEYEEFDVTSTKESNGDIIEYAPLVMPEDFETNFEHLYGLDSAIGRIRLALESGLDSDWTHRFNCALIGPPGCGKSDICGTVKRIFGEDAVLEFDATAMTAAGAIKELTEREILPRIVVIEEIEKADEKSLAFLLSILDIRSEIRKITARASIQRDTKLFAIATVNNDELFGKLNAGALASRFPHKIWFSRPDRDKLSMILHREVAKVNGDYSWIEPTLDFCDVQDIADPRQVIAHCLTGRDKLLTGQYQKMMADTTKGYIREVTSLDWSTVRKSVEEEVEDE